jgi:hypothetical protein
MELHLLHMCCRSADNRGKLAARCMLILQAQPHGS